VVANSASRKIASGPRCPPPRQLALEGLADECPNCLANNAERVANHQDVQRFPARFYCCAIRFDFWTKPETNTSATDTIWLGWHRRDSAEFRQKTQAWFGCWRVPYEATGKGDHKLLQTVALESHLVSHATVRTSPAKPLTYSFINEASSSISRPSLRIRRYPHKMLSGTHRLNQKIKSHAALHLELRKPDAHGVVESGTERRYQRSVIGGRHKIQEEIIFFLRARLDTPRGISKPASSKRLTWHTIGLRQSTTADCL